MRRPYYIDPNPTTCLTPEDLAEIRGPVAPGAALTIRVVEGWPLATDAVADEEPRIRDLDLGERLGYDRPRDIRKLIERLMKDGKLSNIHVRATVARTQMPPPGGIRETVVDEYWLTEVQALKVAAKSETEAADALLDEMIRVFTLVRRGLLHADPEAGLRAAFQRAMDAGDREAARRYHAALAPLLQPPRRARAGVPSTEAPPPSPPPPSPTEQRIANWLAAQAEGASVRMHDVLTGALGLTPHEAWTRKGIQRDAGAALRRLGWTVIERTHGERRARAWRRP